MIASCKNSIIGNIDIFLRICNKKAMRLHRFFGREAGVCGREL